MPLSFNPGSDGSLYFWSYGCPGFEFNQPNSEVKLLTAVFKSNRRIRVMKQGLQQAFPRGNPFENENAQSDELYYLCGPSCL